MTTEEIKKAARKFLPVRYKGIKYRRVAAVTWRVIETQNSGTYKEILQVELEDYCGHSTTIAETGKVELIDDELIKND